MGWVLGLIVEQWYSISHYSPSALKDNRDGTSVRQETGVKMHIYGGVQVSREDAEAVAKRKMFRFVVDKRRFFLSD